MNPRSRPFVNFKYSFLKILTGSDLSRRRLPLMVAESAEPHPVVWLTACVHGDEVGGMVVVQEVFKVLHKQGLKRGAIYAFPLMNPIGFETGSRSVTMSKEDLNRSFPGSKNGSLAERIADIIFSAVTETEPDMVLDLHNDWMKSVPYALIDEFPGDSIPEAFDVSRSFALKSGFLTVLDRDRLTRSLSFSLIKRGIPALTLELGESLVVNERNVHYGVKSIVNILSQLDMIDSPSEPFRHPLMEGNEREVFHFSAQPVSSTSGIIRFLVKPGDFVKKSKAVARIYNPFGKLRETIVSLNDGIVLGHADSSVAFPGAPVMAFAVK